MHLCSMIFTFRHITIAAMLILSSCGQNDTPSQKQVEVKVKVTPPVKPPRPGKEVVILRPFSKSTRTPYEDMLLRSGDSLYICSYKGKIEIADSLKKNRSFVFDLKSEFMIDRLFIHKRNNGQYFACWQETDHEGIKTYFAGFSRGADKTSWKMVQPLPNPAEPVIHEDIAFVSTLGSVGKINLNAGRFEWRLDSLYTSTEQRYQKFEPAFVFEEYVMFVDYPIKGRREKRDTLRLNLKNGKTHQR
ncbi:MAG: hypothetical protein Fur0041_17330 [Bacteroidia bacterium]